MKRLIATLEHLAADTTKRADDPAFGWSAEERAEILGLAEGYRSAARIAREQTHNLQETQCPPAT